MKIRSIHDPTWRRYVDARLAAVAAFDRGDWDGACRWGAEADARQSRWRGYDSPSPLGLGPVRMVVDDLLVSGITDRGRIVRAIGLTGLGFDSLHEHLLAITIADPLRWSRLDEWRDWFKATTWVPGWPEDVFAGPEPEATADDQMYRASWSVLPNGQALALAVDRDVIAIEALCEQLGVTYEAGLGIVRGLVAAGLAEHPAPVRTRLAKALTILELKTLATAHGLRATGRKEAILDTLVSGVAGPALEAVQTPDYIQLPRPGSPWMAWRRGFAGVWAATLVATFYRRHRYQQYHDADAWVEIDGHSCPACTAYEGRIAPSDLTAELLPPFHPGCTCSPDPIPADEI